MRNQRPTRRDPKKTVSIEARVSEEEKRAFTQACRAANRPVSQVLRGLMGVFVSLHSIRQWISTTMTFLLFRPLRTAFASISAAAMLATGVFLVPSASADIRMAYQVNLDDGIGRIVSEGVTSVSSGNGVSEPVADTLGETVRYSITAQPCGSDAGPSCPAGAAHVVISLWDNLAGAGWTETDRGIVTATSGETRFEEQLGEGRSITVIFSVLPQS
ncbi:hypothetical protein [Hyphobacterium marinum]|uniref:Uncharacterized protein n=1 Tax=Hyphobacterium marinum TaxID=3116574 RepID=A0ABU7LWK6_9PROT|nr:hypothetical protein [Hyphobacterium sp. Y6023]MEE2565941.1 hypothetical protein [Hyphobacterium sp. Y6023]